MEAFDPAHRRLVGPAVRELGHGEAAAEAAALGREAFARGPASQCPDVVVFCSCLVSQMF